MRNMTFVERERVLRSSLSVRDLGVTAACVRTALQGCFIRSFAVPHCSDGSCCIAKETGQLRVNDDSGSY